MRKTNILLVDDHQENIDALSGLIAADDVQIYSALNADEALKLLTEHDFGLALLDVQMPVTSGFELARLIRGVKKFRNLPIIFVTAHQESRDVAFEGYMTGAVDLLFKPLSPQVVRSKVRVFVELNLQDILLKEQVLELQRLRIEADEANVAKSQFLANMSHEIRTPLGVMIGFTDLMLDPKIGAEERARYGAVLKRNGDQLSAIINDILDLSKVEAGFLKVENEEFSLKWLLEDLITAFSIRAKEKGLEIRLVCEPTGDAQFIDNVVSDSLRLRQILFNLLSNAIKFTERGNITVTVRSDIENISMEVSDTGIGLAPEAQSKLFRPFTQADGSTTRRFGGTGLGLTLSKKLAHLLGGDLRLKSSEPDRGSSFVLHVANRSKFIDTGIDSVADAKGKAVRKDNIELQHCKVLLVEDSVDNQQLIMAVLSKQGAVLEIAQNGAEGVEKALKGKFDVVLMDVQMPVMDGYTATQRLREQGFRKPIIALTAHAMSEVRKKCLEVGYTDYLPKPIDLHELVAKVDEYTRGSRGLENLV